MFTLQRLSAVRILSVPISSIRKISKKGSQIPIQPYRINYMSNHGVFITVLRRGMNIIIQNPKVWKAIWTMNCWKPTVFPDAPSMSQRVRTITQKRTDTRRYAQHCFGVSHMIDRAGTSRAAECAFIGAAQAALHTARIDNDTNDSKSNSSNT